MIIELVFGQNSFGLYINGQTPSVKEWSVGGEGLSQSFITLRKKEFC
jgi:hypothetical protein